MFAIGIQFSGVQQITELTKSVPNGLLLGMARGLQVVAGEIRRSIKEWLSSGKPDNVRRTGALMRSFRPSVDVSLKGEFRGKVTSDLPYAAIQEYGGVIVAKRTKFLAVPLKAFPIGTTPRGFGDTVLVRGKSGNLLIARKLGKKGRLDFLYVLKRSVRIHGKGYLKRAEERAAPKVEALVAQELETSITPRGGI